MKRIGPVIIVSLLVNFFLFFMMTRMLAGKKLKPKETLDAQHIELIDLKSQDKTPKKIKKAKRPLLPKTPPPLKVKKLPPLRPLPPPPKPKPPEPPPPEKIRIEPPPPLPIPDPAPVVLPPEPPPIPEETVEPEPPPEEPLPPVEEVPVVEDIQPIEEPPPVPVEATPPEPEFSVPEPSVIEEAPAEAVESETVQAVAIEVDVIPLVRVQPHYPRRAIRAKLEGMVTIEFIILTDGSVSDAIVIASKPPKVFDRSALSAIREWKFTPKQVKGRAVVRRAIQNIRFSLGPQKK